MARPPLRTSSEHRDRLRQTVRQCRELLLAQRPGRESLAHLVAAAQGLSGAVAAGFYARSDAGLEMIAGTGTAGLLPAMLEPQEGSDSPWDRALLEGRMMHVGLETGPEQDMVAAQTQAAFQNLSPVFPLLPVSFLPVLGGFHRQALWVLCGLEAEGAQAFEEAARAELNFLAAMALEFHRLAEEQRLDRRRFLSALEQGEEDREVSSAPVLWARWQALLDSVNEGVWLIDTEGRVRQANQRLGQLLGLETGELRSGRQQGEIVRRLENRLRKPEEAFRNWQQLQHHPQEVRWDELELLHPVRRVLERYARPVFGPDGRVEVRLEIYRDVTAQRFLGRKALHRERLAAAGQLLTTVAHELNNPLTTVVGYAQLLLEKKAPGDLPEIAQQLRREAERASRIIRNLLLFARDDEGEKKPVRLPAVLDAVLELRSYELKVKNIQVRRSEEEGLPPVLGIANQLEQVFLNLLLNAEQAIRSRRDSGAITVRVFRAEPGRVCVQVEDDGPGISPAALPYIFDPFFTTKPGEHGTGLGLAIAQTIVREHGGEIQVENIPGGGASFQLFLPVASEAVPAEAPSVAPRWERAILRSARVLIVDDEPTVASMIADVLEQDGCRVEFYTESEQGLEAALREDFDLIICDIRMPGMDGPAFHRVLSRKDPARARRLLFTTGDTLARNTRAFLEKQKLPFLAKPFLVGELREAVQRALAQSKRPHQGAT